MKFKVCPQFLILLLFSINSLAQSTFTNSYSQITIASNGSIFSQTENSKNHKMLLAAMKAAELDDILGFDGPFTVFAPSDSAFEKLPRDTVAQLLDPTNKKEVQALMAYHIIAGNFSASKILRKMCSGEGKAIFTTINGDELTATMQGVDIVLTDKFGNQAKITTADSNHCNGVIHEIDAVVRPSKLK
jgi:uncharacterized surface protein with fasciclin (FAS1) repeats